MKIATRRPKKIEEISYRTSDKIASCYHHMAFVF